MNRFTIIAFVFIFNPLFITGQEAKMTDEQLPYVQIPDYPEEFNNGTIVARFIDGLGYRYYWATEGLTATDLAYEPGNEGRKTEDVLDHLLGLSSTIKNASENKPNVRSADKAELSWKEKRAETLKNFETASLNFKNLNSEDFEKNKVIFQRGENTTEFPLWNLFNGMLSDAIYHVGQIVSFRRSSGNPINPKVSVFRGKNRE